jgi:hypothetical protein
MGGIPREMRFRRTAEGADADEGVELALAEAEFFANDFGIGCLEGGGAGGSKARLW